MGFQNCNCPSCRPHKQPDHEPPCTPCAPWMCEEKERDKDCCGKPENHCSSWFPRPCKEEDKDRDCCCKPERHCFPKPCKEKEKDRDCCCKPEHKPTQVLIPKVICSGREWQRQLCTKLQVSLPECAKSPFTLLSVQQSGAFPWWEPVKDDCKRDRLMYHVYIPVCCCVKDACGCDYFVPSVVEMEACLQLNCNPSECWRHNLVIVPCVRLVCPPVCSKDECFEVVLEVVLELFLIHWQVVCNRPPKPSCPQLPLFPQPCSHPYTS